MNKWQHRIDAVPQVGQRIEFRRGDEPSRFGRVVAPKLFDDYYRGCGDDVRILPDGGALLLIPTHTYDYWRYAD